MEEDPEVEKWVCFELEVGEGIQRLWGERGGVYEDKREGSRRAGRSEVRGGEGQRRADHQVAKRGDLLGRSGIKVNVEGLVWSTYSDMPIVHSIVTSGDCQKAMRSARRSTADRV